MFSLMSLYCQICSSGRNDRRIPRPNAAAAFAGSIAAIGGGIAASVWSWSSDSSIAAGAPSSFTVKAESPAGEAPVSC